MDKQLKKWSPQHYWSWIPNTDTFEHYERWTFPTKTATINVYRFPPNGPHTTKLYFRFLSNSAFFCWQNWMIGLQGN